MEKGYACVLRDYTNMPFTCYIHKYSYLQFTYSTLWRNNVQCFIILPSTFTILLSCIGSRQDTRFKTLRTNTRDYKYYSILTTHTRCDSHYPMIITYETKHIRFVPCLSITNQSLVLPLELSSSWFWTRIQKLFVSSRTILLSFFASISSF